MATFHVKYINALIAVLIQDIQILLQIWHLPPEVNAERIEGALPCHNYQGFGETPQGCW